MFKMSNFLSSFLATFFMLYLISAFSILVLPIKAELPVVTSLSYDVRTVCCRENPPLAECWLIITIRHSSSSSNDYIEKIEVEWNSTVIEVSAPSHDVQQTDVFEVQVSLGNNTVVEQTESTASVRAYSTNDGWGAWSDSVIVHEFCAVFLVFAFAVNSGIVVLFKRFAGKH